ncbi:unnamed protein product [Cunninghamella blakesleeana]
MEYDSDLEMFGFEDEMYEDEFEEDSNISEEENNEEETNVITIKNKSFTRKDLEDLQTKKINHVSSLIFKSKKRTVILLRQYQWNVERLLEDFFSNPDNDAFNGLDLDFRENAYELLTHAGITESTECSICLDVGFECEFICTNCGHAFCKTCYHNYIMEKITNGFYVGIECMDNECHFMLEDELVGYIVGTPIYKKYKTILYSQYIEDMKNLKWCTFPDCQYIIEINEPSSANNTVAPIVECACGNRFCFACDLEDHRPAPCSLVKSWLRKVTEDTPSMQWINSNTKPCPFCTSPIEKRGGCQHMTCRKCHREFCWICMSTVLHRNWYNHNCSRIRVNESSNQVDNRVNLFKRYVESYDRYSRHLNATNSKQKLYADINTKMEYLQNKKKLSWIDTQVLIQAAELTIQSHNLLKWCDVFAYYVQPSNEIQIFEANYKDVDETVTKLHNILKGQIKELTQSKRLDIMNMMNYIKSRIAILLIHVNDGLQEEVWKFGST